MLPALMGPNMIVGKSNIPFLLNHFTQLSFTLKGTLNLKVFHKDATNSRFGQISHWKSSVKIWTIKWHSWTKEKQGCLEMWVRSIWQLTWVGWIALSCTELSELIGMSAKARIAGLRTSIVTCQPEKIHLELTRFKSKPCMTKEAYIRKHLAISSWEFFSSGVGDPGPLGKGGWGGGVVGGLWLGGRGAWPVTSGPIGQSHSDSHNQLSS